MISVDVALQHVLDGLKPLPSLERPLSDALGCVLAEAVVSLLDLPPFPQSAVDGYAVRHADITTTPVSLPVVQTIAAAARAQAPVLAPATAARIFTGGWMPQGADTAVRQEITDRDGEQVKVLKDLAPGTDVRQQGEELRRGDIVADAGRVLSPGLIGAIAMSGVSRVRIHRMPRICVLVTGDEVAKPGQDVKAGQIADANGPLLSAYLRSWGYAAVDLEYVRDDFETLRIAIDRALGDADVVLTTGGVSVGDHDHVPAAAQACGAHTLLWKVAQKPGMPLFVASRGHSRLFGLPGNPASVLVNLLAYVQPALQQLQGRQPSSWRQGYLSQAVRAEAEKTLWLRSELAEDAQGRIQLIPLGRQASHMLSNLAQAEALVRVPPSATPWPAGTPLIWKPLASIENR